MRDVGGAVGRFRFLLPLAALGLLATCGDPSAPSDEPPVLQLTVPPDTVRVAVAGTFRPAVLATVDGRTLAAAAIQFSSADPSIATVDSSGTVRGVRRGLTAVHVHVPAGPSTGNGGDGSVPVRVIVAGIRVPRPSDTLTALGDTLYFQPGFIDASGQALPPADSAAIHPSLSLRSAGSAVSLVAATGALVATAPGTDTIRAVVDTAHVDLVVTVRQVADSVALAAQFPFHALGQSRALSVEVFDRHGNPIDSPPVQWQSSDSDIVAVSLDGVATATGNGSVVLSATVDGRSDSTVAVVQQIAAHVSVTPGSDTLAVGHTLSLAAEAVDSNGFAVPSTTAGFTWRSSDTSVAMVDGTGLVTATDTGAVDVTATAAGGIEGTAGLRVVFLAESLVVSPDSVRLTAIGQTFHLTAVPYAPNGVAYAGLPVSWGSSNPAAVKVDSTGVLTAQANGLAVVRASRDGVEDSLLVTVRQRVDTVAVSPGVVVVVPGDTMTLSVRLADARGYAVTDVDVDWASGVPAVVSVDGNGRITALTPGSTTVTATADGASGVAAVTVTQTVDSVAVIPAAPSIPSLGDTVRLTAVALDVAGDTVHGLNAQWESLDPSLAVVDSTGLVTAVANGVATIQATVGGVAGLGDVTVQQVPASVTVGPSSASITALGDTLRLTAAAADAKGYAINGASFTWSSGDTLVARVDASGLVTATGNGSAAVTAAAGSAFGVATVGVAQVPTSVTIVTKPDTLTAIEDTVRLVAEARDARGYLVAGAAFSWLGGDALVAEVDGSGLVTAAGNGTVVITATAGAASAAVDVVVRQAVASVAVSPDLDTIVALGDTVRLTAVMRDARGHVVDDVEAGWTSDAPTIADVDAGGLVTAVANGVTRVVANGHGVVDTAVVVVRQRVDSIVVSPDRTTLSSLDDTVRLAAQAFDARGHPIDGTTFGWSSGDTTVLKVDATPQARSVANGTATVRAEAEGVGGEALITVRQVVTSLTVTAPADTLRAIDDTVRLSAAGFDAHGYPVPDAVFSWASRDTLVLRVDPEGLATAALNGSATVVAAADAARDSIGLVVRQRPASVEVSPSLDTLRALRDSLSYTAVVRDARGHAIGDAVVTWSSDDTTVAAVVGASLVEARANGTATVTALATPAQGTATLVVRQRPSSLAVSPARDTMTSLNDTLLLSAQVFDARGFAIGDAVASWRSADTTIARVDAGGAVVAVRNGTVAVQASADLATDSALVVVRQVADSVAVSPRADTLTALGDTTRVVATAFDARRNVIPDGAVAWSSSVPGVVAVDGDGLVTAVANGVGGVVAAAGDRTDTATVVVAQQPASVAVSPGDTSLAGIGATASFAAVVRDANDSVIPSAAVEWQVLRPDYASVSSDGQLAVVKSGQVLLQAKADTATGQAVVTMTAPGATPAGSWTKVASGTFSWLSAIWASSANDVWALGASEVAVHFDGTAWDTVAMDSHSEWLFGAWGSRPDDIWAVGGAGAILHYDGSAWTHAASPDTTTLRGIWGSAPDDVWAVGSRGTLVHWDGSSWSKVGSPTTASLWAVWGSARDDVWAVGNNGSILHFNGAAWTEESPGFTAHLYAIWGSGPGNIVAVGSSGTIVRYNGASWSSMTSPTTSALAGLGGSSASEIWASGQSGTLLRFDGSAWSTVSSGTTSSLSAVLATAPGYVWLAGQSGEIIRGSR